MYVHLLEVSTLEFLALVMLCHVYFDMYILTCILTCILTSLKLVLPWNEFSELFGPTLKIFFHYRSAIRKKISDY